MKIILCQDDNSFIKEYPLKDVQNSSYIFSAHMMGLDTVYINSNHVPNFEYIDIIAEYHKSNTISLPTDININNYYETIDKIWNYAVVYDYLGCEDILSYLCKYFINHFIANHHVFKSMMEMLESQRNKKKKKTKKTIIQKIAFESEDYLFKQCRVSL